MPLHYDEGETCLQIGTRLKKSKIRKKKGLMKEEEDTLVTGRSDVNVPKRVKPVPFIFDCLCVCNVLHMVAVVAVGGPHVRPVDRPVFSCSRCF